MSRDEKHLIDQEPAHLPPQPANPMQGSKTWAIAIIVSAALLLAAAGIIVWLVYTRSAGTVTVSAPAKNVADVKNVSFIAPTDLPAAYSLSDQSEHETTRVLYYDDATACGFTAGVIATAAQTPVPDAVLAFITSGQAKGVTTASQTEGTGVALADADDTNETYDFKAIQVEQDIKVQGVPFTKQSNVILYKQFGGKTALLGYACKAETWAQKQTELATLAAKFTVKTER